MALSAWLTFPLPKAGHKRRRRHTGAVDVFAPPREDFLTGGTPAYMRAGRMNLLSSWLAWAVASAIFAALTAIFAKVGVENINSDLATFIRTIVVIVTLGFLLGLTGQFQAPGTISARSRLERPPRWRRSTSCRWCWWRCSAWYFSASG
jgi:hypothetical protein